MRQSRSTRTVKGGGSLFSCKPYKFSIAFTVLGLTALMGPTAAAQVGISARTAGMGGTGVATAQGGEGLFYNPAVLPASEFTELGLSASAYGYQSQTFDDYFLIQDEQGNSESASLSVKSLSAFPSAASTVYPFELSGRPAALGFGLFVPTGAALQSTVLFDPTLYPLSREGVQEDTRTEYWMNAAGAMDFGALSVGVGAVAQVTQIKQLFSLSFFEVGPRPSSPYIDLRLESVEAIAVDMRAQVGLHLDLGALKVGLMVLSPTANLGGSAKYRANQVISDPSFGTSLDNLTIEHAGAENYKPLEFSLGGALVLQDTMFTVEASVRLPRSYNEVVFEGDQGPDALNEPLVLRVALGGAMKVGDDLEVRAGLFAVPLPQELPSQEEIDGINGQLTALANGQATVTDQEIEALNNAFEAAGNTDIRQYGGSVGVSMMRGTGRADVSLTGVLFTGHHISIADKVGAGAELQSALAKSPITGFAVFASIGGTYGFDGSQVEVSSHE